MEEYKNRDWLYNQLLTKTQKQIAEEQNISLGKLETIVKKLDLQNFKERFVYKEKESLFKVTDPAFCYLLGLFVTDGYFNDNGTVQIDSKDKQHLEILASYFNVKLYYCNTTYSYRLTFPAILKKYFTELGFKPGKKTFDCIYPEVPNELEYLLVRGMIDGDGTIRKDCSNLRFFSCSPELTKGVKNFIRRQEKNISSYEQKPGWIIGCSDFEFMIDLYKEYPEYSLPRKRKLIENKVNDIVRAYEMVNHKKWNLNDSTVTN